MKKQEEKMAKYVFTDTKSNIHEKLPLSSFGLDLFAGINPKEVTPDQVFATLDTPDSVAHLIGEVQTAKMAEKQIEVYKQEVLADNLYDEVKAVADQLSASHTDITIGYENWRDVGFALISAFGERGRSLFHQVCNMNPEYTPEDCDDKFNKLLRGDKDGIHINTFFWMAQRAGVDLSLMARERLKDSANYANLPFAKNIEKVENTTFLGDFESEMANGNMANMANSAGSGYIACTFSDKVKDEDWPSFLLPVLQNHDDPVSRDKMLLGVLNVVSGLMGGANGTTDCPSGIYGLYDGRKVYAPLYTIIYGTAGSAKGDLVFCKRLADPVKKEMHQQYAAAMEQYEQDKAAYETACKGKKKGERGPAPKEPPYQDPFVPGNSSASAVYRTLDANQGWGLMFETEGDTVSTMIASDYGNYSDLMRKAFHHEPLTMCRITDHLHIDIDNPRLAFFITCTPGQLPTLVPSYENGTGSRLMFYGLPDGEVKFHNVFAFKERPLEDIYQEMGQQLMPLFSAMQMRKGHPLQFVMSHTQQTTFIETYQDILKEQFSMLGNGIQPVVYRTALSGFRYAMVLTALRRLSEWDQKDSIFDDDENALLCDERDFSIAMKIMGCLICHTSRAYSVLAKENDNPFAKQRAKLTSAEQSIYDELPEGPIKSGEIKAIAAKHDMSDRTASRLIKKLSHECGLLQSVTFGLYCKPAAAATEQPSSTAPATAIVTPAKHATLPMQVTQAGLQSNP